VVGGQPGQIVLRPQKEERKKEGREERRRERKREREGETEITSREEIRWKLLKFRTLVLF
jgi:hypothetical protein